MRQISMLMRMWDRPVTAARAFAAALAFLLLVGGRAGADVVTYDRGDLAIQTSSGVLHFSVEIANTEAKREQGLMFRESMPENAGMLFLFGTSKPVEFWMKNTLIPLDMLFIGSDGKIRNIAARAVPLSTVPIPSAGPVVSVLELNGGAADRLGIKAGDQVEGAILADPAGP